MIRNKKIGDYLRFNRRGDFKWDIVVILLLGLVVLSLILYFIFGEYFQNDDIDWEVCRQSIVLRNSLPEKTFAGMYMVSFKDKFPLKCKTGVITIDYNDTKRAQKEISEAMVSCWFLFGNGGYKVFPGSAIGSGTSCVYCARIHISPSVRGYYKENVINIEGGLDSDYKNGLTYYEYLKNIGNQNPFQLITNWRNDYLTIGTGKAHVVGSSTFNALPIGVPGTFDVERGDLFILYHNFIAYGNSETVASLLYFQEKGVDYSGKYFDSALDALAWERDTSVIREDISWWFDARVNAICEEFDGIPA